MSTKNPKKVVIPTNFLRSFIHRISISELLKGICEELYQHYCTLPEESKGAAFFVGSGNGVRMNPLLQKICCDRFGMELKIPKYSEEAAYGASLFVLLACGKYQTLSEVQKLISYE